MYRRNKGEKLEDASPGDERRSFSTLGREVAELVPDPPELVPDPPELVPDPPELVPDLPELVPDPPEPLRLDRARPNYFLVLSNSCSTCQAIGSGLAASASRWESAITVLVASDSERHGQERAASVGLDSPWGFVDDRGKDDRGKYARQLGVSSSPTVVRVEHGRLTAAANLTSLRSSRSSSTGSRPTDRPATRAGQDRRCQP